MIIDVNTYLKSLKDEQNRIDAELRAHKAKMPISFPDYVSLLKARAELIFKERGVERQFNIDVYNERIIKELYCYLTMHPKGSLNPHIGIMMMGGYGSGKTVLLKAHCEVSSILSGKRITYVHAEALVSLIKAQGDAPFVNKPLLIDELGREKLEAKNFGEALKPITDLLALRYDSGGRTYVTTNFNLDTHEERYGKFIRTRMEEMMNVITLKGGSRRLSHELK